MPQGHGGIEACHTVFMAIDRGVGIRVEFGDLVEQLHGLVSDFGSFRGPPLLPEDDGESEVGPGDVFFSPQDV